MNVNLTESTTYLMLHCIDWNPQRRSSIPLRLGISAPRGSTRMGSSSTTHSTWRPRKSKLSIHPRPISVKVCLELLSSVRANVNLLAFGASFFSQGKRCLCMSVSRLHTLHMKAPQVQLDTFESYMCNGVCELAASFPSLSVRLGQFVFSLAELLHRLFLWDTSESYQCNGVAGASCFSQGKR